MVGMKPIIKMEKVTKTYQMDSVKSEILHGIDMSIKHNEFVSIMGASGSGKSTLLNLIGALDKPSSGHVYIDGVDISGLDSKNLARLRGEKIGFIFQTFNLYPTLTTAENVELPMIIMEKEEKKRKEVSCALLKKIGLGERINYLPTQLSGGERQRVAIARALANDPAIILADEPTGNLDSKMGIEIMKIFMKLHNEGKTIIMVTHEKSISDFSERIIHIKDGKIIGGAS